MSMLHITIYERRVGGEAGLIIGAVTGTFSVPSTSGLTPQMPSVCSKLLLEVSASSWKITRYYSPTMSTIHSAYRYCSERRQIPKQIPKQ